MSKLRLLMLAVASLFLVSTIRATRFADSVIAYDLGSGSASGFTNASTVLGAPASTVNPFSPGGTKSRRKARQPDPCRSIRDLRTDGPFCRNQQTQSGDISFPERPPDNCTA